MAINLAHQNQKLKCPVASFRILGFFETADDVREHTGSTPELDVFTVPVFSWFPITRGPVENPETRTQQVVDRVKAYIASRTDEIQHIIDRSTDDDATKRALDAQALGEGRVNIQEQLSQLQQQGSEAPRVKHSQKLPEKYAVVSIICDADLNDEPLVQFFQAFTNREDAQDYLRNTLHEAQVPTDAFVIKMYDWVTPLHTTTPQFVQTVNASYTHKEMEELHGGRMADQAKIQALLSQQRNDVTEEAQNLIGETKSK